MPIIDPWFIYALQLVDGLHEVNSVVLLLSILFGLIAAIVCFLMDASNSFDGESNSLKFFKSNLLKPFIFVIVFTSCVSLFVPTKTTLVGMLVAQNVTYERVDMAKEELEEFVDRILDRVEVMVNEKKNK